MSSLRSPFLFLIFTVIGILVLIYPALDVQPYLAQGDIGRDLYAFEQTGQGAEPYRDYWWVYGPLMPYYYAPFVLIFGANVQSVLIGFYLLVFLSALFLHRTLSVFVSPVAAMLGTFWFVLWRPDFFYTFNHMGGILLLILAVYYLTRFLFTSRNGFWIAGIVVCGLLNLVKINFGVIAFAVLMTAGWIRRPSSPAERKQFTQWWWAALVAIPILTVGVYAYFLRGLTLYEIRQCLPYLSGDQPHSISLLTSMRLFIFDLRALIHSNSVFGAFFLFIGLTLLGLVRTFRHRDRLLPPHTLWILAGCATLYLLSLHEYLMSGVRYRLLWSYPFAYLILFAILDYGSRTFPRLIRILIFGGIGIMIVISGLRQYQNYRNLKRPEHFMRHPKIQIFTHSAPEWIAAVETTASFLDAELEQGETFFALPYDVLYYYLASRTTPTRQLIFFDHIKIPYEQEVSIIEDLKRNQVNWVLISNRMKSREQGLGEFGVTYCPLLAHYIEQNFSPVQQFGDWIHEPGWAWNHGTVILKRK